MRRHADTARGPSPAPGGPRGRAGGPILAVLATAGLMAIPPGAQAQEWSTFSQARQLAGEEALQASVRYGAGELRIGPAEPGALYRVDLRYDEESVAPEVSYAGGALSVGVTTLDDAPRIRSDRAGELDLALPREIPTELDLEFGAVRADLDLGGLRLRSLDLSTGASDSRIRVAERNRERIDEVRLSVGAARFEAVELANLNARRLVLEAGVGDLTLDLGGEWESGSTMEVEAEMGLGSLEIRVPPDVGVRVSRNTFLVPLDGPELEERNGAHVSGNWDDAASRVDISVSGALGRLRVVRPD